MRHLSRNTFTLAFLVACAGLISFNLAADEAVIVLPEKPKATAAQEVAPAPSPAKTCDVPAEDSQSTTADLQSTAEVTLNTAVTVMSFVGDPPCSVTPCPPCELEPDCGGLCICTYNGMAPTLMLAFDCDNSACLIQR